MKPIKFDAGTHLSSGVELYESHKDKTLNTIYNALIVPAQLTQPERIETVETDVAALQKLVAGNIESITRRDWHVYLSGEGSRLPQNVRAEVLAREAGVHLEDTLNGSAVFLGHRIHGESDAPSASYGLPNSFSTHRWQPNYSGGTTVAAAHEPQQRRAAARRRCRRRAALRTLR